MLHTETRYLSLLLSWNAVNTQNVGIRQSVDEDDKMPKQSRRRMEEEGEKKHKIIRI